jgi:signal transduction histidine kinase/putative methionine-R-sulfoxide reductase with GAF domain
VVVTGAGLTTGLADEQAALRRVATMVARAAPPDEVYAAVAAEVGQLLAAELTAVGRFDGDGMTTAVGVWSSSAGAPPVSVGSRGPVRGSSVVARVFETGRPARIDDYVSGPDAAAGAMGVRAAVGVPITVAGTLWGVMTVMSMRAEPPPADTEARLAGFVELVATAIANAQARLELRAQAEEQAALRRVATLVARASAPEEVFAAVTAEVGRVLDVDCTMLSRYDPGDAATILSMWRRTGEERLPATPRFQLGGRNVHSDVFRTGRPARTERADASGPAADVVRDWAFQSVVGAPVSVAGRLWGVVVVAYTREQSLPAGTEGRLTAFTELVAAAIAGAQARLELRGHAEAQATLRRIATLVARAAPADELFAAVAGEVGQLLRAGFALLNRYDADGTVVTVGAWSRTGGEGPFPVGTRWALGGRNVTTMVFSTGRPARIDAYADADGPAGELARERGARSIVGAPIKVGGRLWGFLSVVATDDVPPPADAESRLAGFAGLVGTAVANAEAQQALTASRARLVAAADTTRRRIERDLHDGAQQRLVSVARQLREVQSAVPPEADQLGAELELVAAGLTGVLDELSEIARGIHPAVLVEGGLERALEALARRSAVPVRLDVRTTGRLPEPIEMAAYYLVSEALTNTAKHAAATAVEVRVSDGAGCLRVRVRDDGRGGADTTRGSGIVGLTDRVEALGGRLRLHSPAGAGTTLEVDLPLDGGAAAPV